MSDIYTVVKIEGEYAYIQKNGSTDEIFIALALLPLGVDIGSTLSYENFEFKLV